MNSMTVTDNPSEHRYEIRSGDALAGFADYTLKGKAITFTHTEVGAGYAGQGVGSQLVTYALDDARRRGLGVSPECPFVRSFIDRHRDAYLDLVPEARRRQFGLGPTSD